MRDFRNTNGLVDGKIPARKPCPFLHECNRINDNCPIPNKTKDNNFSCGFARGWSIIRETKDD